MKKITLNLKFIKLILILIVLIVYFYAFVVALFRFTVLPAVDGNIAKVIQKTIVVTPETQEDCFKAGGEWRKPGPWSRETCMVPYKDGGKTCFAGLQCEARDCLFSSGPSNDTIVATGFCPKYQIYFDCIQKVHFGITDKAICLD